MWLVLQLLVAFAVASGIIYFDSQTGVRTGGPAIGVLAFGAAWLVTWLLSRLLDLKRRKTKLSD